MADFYGSECCPACRGLDWTIDDISGRLLGLEEPYKVQFCKNCGLGRLVPQLSIAELQSLYAGSYFNSEQHLVDPTLKSQAPDADYLSQIVPMRLAKFSRTLSELQLLAPQARTFLDVGAATGEMVKIAREAGLEADGLEYSEFAVREARKNYGIELLNMPLSQVHHSAGYDIIHLNHVFEHFNEPRCELASLRRLINPRGLLYIEVPSQFHIAEKIRFLLKPNTRRFTLESLHHPFFYNIKSLRLMLGDYGFEIVDIRVFDESRYPASTLLKRVKRLIWRSLSILEVGNYIEIVARPATVYKLDQ